ncbi:hypothetical protein GALL_547510 [mine drainage metagenome]|uniref:Uncharacterized protein n=1 Tax=mine drainage metagenome TaxID=410659 RepID=A0A1J5P8D0_9ZZZZ
MPADLACYLTADNGRVQQNLFGTLVMAHCLTGAHPHTSVLLSMKKEKPEIRPVEFIGYQDTMTFLLKARDQLRTILEESTLYPNPAPWMPEDLKSERWATTYMWLGGRARTVRVKIAVDQPGMVTIGVNKAHSDRYWDARVDITETVHAITREAEFDFPLLCDEAFSYAVYGRALPGCKIIHVSVVLDDARAYSPVAMNVSRPTEANLEPPPPMDTRALSLYLLKRVAKAALRRLSGAR